MLWRATLEVAGGTMTVVARTDAKVAMFDSMASGMRVRIRGSLRLHQWKTGGGSERTVWEIDPESVERA